MGDNMTNLAATVEAGFAAAKESSRFVGAYWGKGVNAIDPAVTDAQTAFAEYKRRVEALEAFVREVMKTASLVQPPDILPKLTYSDTHDQNASRLRRLGTEARALLADDTAAGADGLST